MRFKLFNALDFSNEEFDLTRYILTSELRLNLILNLYDGEKVFEEIRLHFDKNPGNLIRGLNELIEKKLVVKYDKSYSLSNIGYLIALNIINLFDNWDAINSHHDFWQKHTVVSFSPEFMRKINIWNDSELIESDNVDIAKTFRIYSEKLRQSKDINIDLPFYSKMYVDLISDVLMKNQAHLNLITNETILDLIYEEDFDNVFDSLVKDGKIDIYLTDYNLELFFTACDNFSSLSLFFDKQLFDDSEMLLIEDEKYIEEALKIFNSFIEGVKLNI